MPAETHVGLYLRLLERGERELARAFGQAAARHAQEPDLPRPLELFAFWCEEHAATLAPLIERDGGAANSAFGSQGLEHALEDVPERPALLTLLRSLHLLAAMTQDAGIGWLVVLQAARALRDPTLEEACLRAREHHERAWRWLRTRLERVSPQALIAPDARE